MTDTCYRLPRAASFKPEPSVHVPALQCSSSTPSRATTAMNDTPAVDDKNVQPLQPETTAARNLRAASLQVEADATLISADITGPNAASASDKPGSKVPPSKTNGHKTADPTPAAQTSTAPADGATDEQPSAILIRRRCGDGRMPLELRVAVIGNVDSGKSTMVGVLTRSMLDNGRGAARSKVFKHSHEDESGRTSAIGQHNLCLDSQVRYPEPVLPEMLPPPPSCRRLYIHTLCT